MVEGTGMMDLLVHLVEILGTDHKHYLDELNFHFHPQLPMNTKIQFKKPYKEHTDDNLINYPHGLHNKMLS